MADPESERSLPWTVTRETQARRYPPDQGATEAGKQKRKWVSGGVWLTHY